LVCLFLMILIIVYITVLMILNIIIKAWSWKKDCSMVRYAVSCDLRFNYVVIVASNYTFNTLFVELKSNALFCHVRIIQGDQKVSVHLMIKKQEFTSNIQSVPREPSDIY
jgi:hypothetical protein